MPPDVDSSVPVSRLSITSYQFNDFIAQETPIEIVPKFSLPRMEGIGGSYGPFSPNYPISVPLWLALYLRETKTCVITPPEFLSESALTEIWQKEIEGEEFQPLFFHFFEVAYQLLTYAEADIPNSAAVLHLVQDIEERRRDRMRASISVFEKAPTLVNPALTVSNLVSTEIQSLRCSLADVMNDAVEFQHRGATRGSMARVSLPSTSSVEPSSAVTPHRPPTSVEGGTTAGITDTPATTAPASQSTAITADEAATTATSDSAPALKRRRTLRQR